MPADTSLRSRWSHTSICARKGHSSETSAPYPRHNAGTPACWGEIRCDEDAFARLSNRASAAVKQYDLSPHRTFTSSSLEFLLIIYVRKRLVERDELVTRFFHNRHIHAAPGFINFDPFLYIYYNRTNGVKSAPSMHRQYACLKKSFCKKVTDSIQVVPFLTFWYSLLNAPIHGQL